MKTFLKIFGSIVATLLAVMLVVPIFLGDKIGEIVKTEANKMLNAKVDFEELDISLFRHFPKASLDISDLSVTGVDKFEGETLVAAERIELAVDILSIFGESFEISKVWLRGPVINGVVLADGSVNWDIMKPSDEPATEETPAEEQKEEEESGEPFKLSLKSLIISDAKISYTDKTPGASMHFHTSPVNLSLSGDMSMAETVLSLAADAGDITFVSGKDSYAAGLKAQLKGDIGAKIEQGVYSLSGMSFSVNSVGATIDGSVQMLDKGIQTDLTLKSPNINFKSILSLVPAIFTKDFEDLTAGGTVKLGATVKGLLSEKSIPAFDLSLSVDNGSFKYAALPQSVENIGLKVNVKNNGTKLDATRVDVPLLAASFGGQSFSASATVATPISDLQFSAKLKGKINLGAIKDIYPLDDDMSLSGIVTADASAAGKLSYVDKGEYDRLSISGQVGITDTEVTYAKLPVIKVKEALATLSPSRAAVEKLSVNIGKSDLSANGSLTNYWGWILRDETLAGNLAVSSKMLDLNELMDGLAAEDTVEPAEQGSTEEKATEQPSADSEVVAVPKNLNLALKASFAKVLFDKMQIDNIKGGITMRNGVLSLDKLSMGLFGGQAVASASYSTVNVRRPQVSLNADFSSASFKKTFSSLEMMAKIAPIFESIEGTYSMNLAAALTLDEKMSPVMNSIDGSGELRAGNFKVSNVKALDVLAGVLKNDALKTITTTEPTIIKFAINDGMVTTKPFDIKIGKTKLTLGGKTGLDASIDYDVAVALPDGINLEGKIGGTFSSPKIKLDAAKVVEDVVNQIVSGAAAKGIVPENTKVPTKEDAVAEAEKAAAKLIETAKAEAQKMIDKVTNPIAKAAAKVAADKLVKEAEKKAAQMIEEARQKAAANK